jgi:hypothetical protein
MMDISSSHAGLRGLPSLARCSAGLNTSLAKNNDKLTSSDDNSIRITATDGKVWDIPRHDNSNSNASECNQPSSGGCSSLAFIVFLGTSCKFHRDPVQQYDPRPIGGIILPDTSPLLALVLEEHKPGKFHRSSVFTPAEVPFKNVIGEWRERTFAIGGPEPLPRSYHWRVQVMGPSPLNDH